MRVAIFKKKVGKSLTRTFRTLCIYLCSLKKGVSALKFDLQLLKKGIQAFLRVIFSKLTKKKRDFSKRLKTAKKCCLVAKFRQKRRFFIIFANFGIFVIFRQKTQFYGFWRFYLEFTLISPIFFQFCNFLIFFLRVWNDHF